MGAPELFLAGWDETKPTVDMLGDLCRQQMKTIESLRDDLAVCERCNHTLSGELLEASEARAAALVSLATQVRSARELTEVCVKQRDTVVTALRGLHQVASLISLDTITDRLLSAWKREVRMAAELLTLIDQAAAAAAARRPG